MKYNIAIVEDNTNIRQALSDYFSRSTRVQCVLAVDTVEKFVKFHRDFLELKLILLDISLYEKSGIDGIPLIRQREPDAEIIMFTIIDDYKSIFQALTKGATGYLLKDIALEELENRIVSTLEGDGALLSPSIAKRIIKHFGPLQNSPNPEETLTANESATIKYLLEGDTYQEIADKMDTNINNVRYYVKNIYRKLHISSRSELLASERKKWLG